MRYASTFRGRAMLLVLVGLAVLLAACDVTRVSVGDRGEQANGDSVTPSGTRGISSDGRWVLFTSHASNLARNDTNANRDVFLRDKTATRTVLVSQGPRGSSADGDNIAGAVSGNGRVATFASTASNLLPAGTSADGGWYGYLWENGHVTLISRAPDGTPLSNSFGFVPVVSANGRWVAFSGGLDPYESTTLFVLDRASGAVKAVGMSEWMYPLALSDDGHTLAAAYFCSTGCRSQGNALFDPIAGTVAWRPPYGAPEYTYTYAESSGLTISDDGRYVAYSLSPVCFAVIDYDACYAQPNAIRILDRKTGQTTTVASSTGMLSYYDLSISGDGAKLVYRAGGETFAWTRAGGVKNLSDIAAPAGVSNPSLSADGRTLAFASSDASNLPGDTNQHMDVFTVSVDRHTQDK